ncbi:MAG: phosphatase PAP2 family protein [Chloroflexi bacterium]|nr:phosphatase PAP2 family protein [Chloroflexota bacterium]
MANLKGGLRRPRRTILVGAGVSLLVAVALSVAAAFMPRLPGDLPLSRGVQSLSSPWLDVFMKTVTFLGDDPVAIGGILALAGLLAVVRRWKDAAAFLGVLALEVLLQGVKLAVDRPRPPAELVRVLETAASGSFPSGHAYHAVVFWGLVLALLVVDIRPRWLRRAVATFLLVVILLSGVARVYMGAHWPTDVLGSILLGIPSVALLVYLRHRFNRVEPVLGERP